MILDRSASKATMPTVLRFAATADPKRRGCVGALNSRDATAGNANIITRIFRKNNKSNGLNTWSLMKGPSGTNGTWLFFCVIGRIVNNL